MDQAAEILDGRRLLGTLHGAIESRRVCKMEIPNTKFVWITLILGIESIRDSHYLLIDRVSGFEKALNQSRNEELEIEFMEADGVPCRFKTRVVQFRPEALWVDLPQSIFRMQKRRYYRVKARLGTELSFRVSPQQQEKAKVRDYSMGGIAFFMERHLKLNVGDQVADVELKIPQDREPITFCNPLGVVIRVEHHPMEKDICVLELELVGMSDATKEQLWRHIFEEQRIQLKKTKRL